MGLKVWEKTLKLPDKTKKQKMFWNVRIAFKSLVKKQLHDLRHAQETY
jgi:hypothetical protein